MKVNFKKALVDFKGQPIKDEKGNEQLASDVICSRLFGAGEGFTSDEKYEAFKLMQKISSNEEVDIIDKESILIKKVCDKQLNAGAYGQIVELLNGNNGNN